MQQWGGEGEGDLTLKGGKLVTGRPQLALPQQTQESQPEASISTLRSLGGQGAPSLLFTVFHPELVYAY